jgi:predicted enzyme related to lactoylglutathione lyase
VADGGQLRREVADVRRTRPSVVSAGTLEPLPRWSRESHYAACVSSDGLAGHQVGLVEFPADDPEQALLFWQGVLGVDLRERHSGEGDGWQTHSGQTELGVHRRGTGPGDRFSLPYFAVPDLPKALRQVEQLGGAVIHPGSPWAICRDSEGNPFALMAAHQQQGQ